MFKVVNGKLFWNDREPLVRDFIISEDVLRSVEFDKIDNAYSQLFVTNGMLIYVVKYDKDHIEPLADKWHFAFQTFNDGKVKYFYESDNLYLGA